MTETDTPPTDFFLAEFSTGELSSRLWRGGLRASEEGYSLEKSARSLALSLEDGLDVRIADGTIESVINDVETCWNDPARMRRACRPMSCKSQASSAMPVSLVKLILSIDTFQPPMITCIVNKVSELGEESCPDKDIAFTLLNQLRWLDFIVDGPALCESLLSIVPIISPAMQKALIEALPEILDDSSRGAAVTELVRILEESPSMMGSVVDALGALGVDDARLPDVHTSIMSTLSAANRDMLPVSIKYLLRNCPQSLLSETVQALRNTLALPSLGPAPGRLCLDAVNAGLRMSKTVADHVVKTLRKIDLPSDHKPADLWILLALLDSPLHRKTAEAVFRKKAAGNAFSRAVLDAALAPFADSFYGLTDRLIDMASIAVRASEVGARRVGVFLYALLFRLFPSGSTRRNVVTALLNHTGTRRPREIDAALESLVLLAKESESDRSLLPHSASIQGLLDFLEFFTDSQLRQIWTLLGFLCRAAAKKRLINGESAKGSRRRSAEAVQDLEIDDDDNGEAELAMLEILLRKELTHSEPFYRRIGVIGACTMIKTLGNCVKNNVLSMLLEVGRSHPSSQAVAFDELAQVFLEGDPATKETAETIRKTISTQFERKYIQDRKGLGSLVKEEVLLPAQLFGNLEDEDVEFCFCISSLVRNEATLKESQDSVRSMVPNLRLLCVITATRFDGSLSEIDAIIGAPLHLPLPSPDQDMDDVNARAKSDLLLSLFIAHGWVVELINGFAEQSSNELRAKCVKRIDNLLELEAYISALIPQVPQWTEVIFDLYNGTRSRLTSGSYNNGVMKGTRGTKKQRTPKQNPSSGQSARASLDWRQYARQVDTAALSLIRVTDPITWRFTETQSEFARDGDPTMETVVLSSKGLQYLLSELFLYMDGLIGGDVISQAVFGMTMFRSSVAGTLKQTGHTSLSEATTDGVLQKLRALRAAVTSLGRQLSRCLRRMFPGEDEFEDMEETSLQIHRSCAVLCLKNLARCLNSAVLTDSASQGLLFSVLASVRLDDEPFLESSDPLTTADIHAAARTAFEQLRGELRKILPVAGCEVAMTIERGPSDMGFEGCCAFLAVMDAVYIHCSERAQSSLGPKFSLAARGVLRHTWDAATLRARRTQKLIPGIVKIYIQYADDPLAAADDLRVRTVQLAERQAGQEKKPVDTQNAPTQGTQSQEFGSLVEQTSYAYTVAILEQYIWLFKNFKPTSHDRTEDAFTRMERFMKAELPLYNLARQNQRTLGPIMRAGRTLVDLFLKICLPFLKENFREHRSSVIQLCKMHQKPTRILQTFCAHSKSIRDTSLTGLVPPLRKSLELLLYRVKDLLQSHNAMEAFQLGNLKHRDINGEVLSSQHMQYKSESEPESKYSSGEETEEDSDEVDRRSRLGSRARSQAQSQGSRGTANTGKTKRSRLSRANKKRKVRQGDENHIGRRGRRDADNPVEINVGDEEHNEVNLDIDEDDTLDEAVVRVKRRRRKRKNRIQEDEDEEMCRRHPLLDDEAGVDNEAVDDEDGMDDLSQFLVFGDEEEEEEE